MRRSWQGMTAAALALLLTITLSGVTEAAQTSTSTGQASAQKEVTKLRLLIDGTASVDIGYVEQGKVMVPVTPVVKAIGGTIQSSKGSTTFKLRNTTVTLTIGSSNAVMNGESVMLSGAAVLREGRLYVPFQAIGNLLGVDSVYRASDKSVTITTKSSKAVVYGYVTDRSGKPVNGSVRFMNVATPSAFRNVTVMDGYYRVALPEGEYKASDLSIVDSADPYTLWTEELFEENFTVHNGERIFMKLEQPKSNLTLDVHYEDGKPVVKGGLTVQTAGRLSWIPIVNGKAYYTVNEKQTLMLDGFSVLDGSKEQWDLYMVYEADPAALPDQLEVVVHKPNVTVSVNIKGKTVNTDSAAVALENKSVGVQDSMMTIVLEKGEGSIYLPDGDYQWLDYWMFSNGQHFRVNKSFSVIAGKASEPLVFEVSGEIVKGKITFNDGAPISSGNLVFLTGDDDKGGCQINPDGTFAVRLPDGEYNVRYYDSTGGSDLLEDVFVVSQGKAVSTELIVYRS